MKIEKVIISGFRSFSLSQEILLSDVTGAIGGNGVGKTSFLLALNRLFGLTQKDRAIRNDDFFVLPGTQLDDVDERNIIIEVKLVFPEIEAGNGDAIPDCFQNMIVDSGEGTAVPYCRVRLTSIYTRDQLGDGDINTKVVWVKTPYSDERGGEEVISEFRHSDRERIKVIYVPAARDPHAQLQEFSGSLIGKFVKSISWTNDPETTLKNSVDTAKQTLAQENGVRVINESVEQTWRDISPAFREFKPRLSFIDDNVKKMLKNVSMDFDNGENQISSKVQDLSDGEKSLFYFSLLKSALELKSNFQTGQVVELGNEELQLNQVFDSEKLSLPNLTLLAIEEPENHLSPHHFGHLLESYKHIASKDTVQAIFTSHSPSIVSRIDPEEIRFFKIIDHATHVRSLKLPDTDDESFTYVKEAVRAYPELYFSKFVILGEGDSEEVILKRIMEAKGMPLDRTMVSIVPLGGRFVNHFWRLLTDLNIPFVTLLDLDLGKEGGAWGRIKYCINQLIKIGNPLQEIDSELTPEQLEGMHNWTISDEIETLTTWVKHFEERYGVFYSSLLDIDYMMLESFYDKYVTTIQAPAIGPRALPEEGDDNYEAACSKVANRIFDEWEGCVEHYDIDYLNYYKYFFLSKGKPLTHKVALNTIEDEELIRDCPEALLRLINKVERVLLPDEEDEIIEEEEVEE